MNHLMQPLLEKAKNHPLYAGHFSPDGNLPVMSRAELYERLGRLQHDQAFRHGTYWSPSLGDGAQASWYFPSDVSENRAQRRMMAAWLARVDLIGPRTVALNLFSAQMMYRTCEIFVNYVEETGGTVLPVTLQAPDENVLDAIHRFSPDTMLSSPGRIMQFCDFLQENNLRLEIPKLIYAGEPLAQPARDLLHYRLGATHIGSVIGSAEAGVWGFSTFKDPLGRFWGVRQLVDLEIIGADQTGYGRLILTNKIRRKHPLIRYDTGQRARLVQGGESELQGLEIAERHSSTLPHVQTVLIGKAQG